MRVSGVAVVLSILAGCGGGGSDSSALSPAPAPAPPSGQSDLLAAQPLLTDNDLALFLPAEATVGESVSLSALPLNGQVINSLNWVQTSGPAVELLSADTQVVGFDVHTAGNYTFTVTAAFASGASQQTQVNIPVSSSQGVSVNVRRDHVAPETGKVSLRVDGTQTISSIQWSQSAGIRIQDLEQQDNLLFFDAPSVNQDEILEFTAAVTFTDGTQSSDLARVLVKNVNINSQGYFPSAYGQVVSTDVKPYRADSPYADALVACVYNNQIDESCSFERLPLLGQVNQNPDIDDVLDRLVVSHQWMGDNFKRFLESSVTQPDMLKMLRATTGIVISYDVRPSFYWSATAAIYLDAANFWLTPEQRDTLNDQPDFRSNFGSDLQFRMPWRYVRDNQYYFPLDGFPAEQRNNKSFSDMEASIAWLMYHELAHANDFFPPARWTSIPMSSSPLSYVNQSNPVSDTLDTRYPLDSFDMKSLAQVRFSGATPDATQRALLPADISGFFEPDKAAMFYSYFTTREDYALLIERFLMHYRLGVSADVGIIGDDDTRVYWGQRGRVGESQLRSRTVFAVRQVFPELTEQEILEGLPSPVLLPANSDWFEAVTIGANGRSRTGTSLVKRDINRELHPNHIDRRRLRINRK